MEINTRDFGVIEIEKDALFDFPEGVYGFEEDTCFALFHKTFDGIPFLYLQSVQNVIPCFLVFEPEDFYPGYAPIVSKEDLAACGAERVEDLAFLVIICARLPRGDVFKHQEPHRLKPKDQNRETDYPAKQRLLDSLSAFSQQE